MVSLKQIKDKHPKLTVYFMLISLGYVILDLGSNHYDFSHTVSIFIFIIYWYGFLFSE